VEDEIGVEDRLGVDTERDDEVELEGWRLDVVVSEECRAVEVVVENCELDFEYIEDDWLGLGVEVLEEVDFELLKVLNRPVEEVIEEVLEALCLCQKTSDSKTSSH
jgi:hypothetical protein